MAKCKCKYCNEEIEKQSKHTLITYTDKGKEKKTNVHITCLDDYNELMAYKHKELDWFDKLYEYIKGVLNYHTEQQLPKSLITRLQDLRNGTMMVRGKGRVNKSKEGYEYPIILDTFLSCGDSIRWAFENKTFTNENNKINYMMAIIDSNINDSYVRFKSKLDADIIKQRNNMMEEEHIIDNNKNIVYNQNITSNKNSGITKFLDDDEL